LVNENTAVIRGGGVDRLSISSFTMKGFATVTPSVGADANQNGKNDVLLLRPHGKVTVVGVLKPEGSMAACITPENYDTTQPVLGGNITMGTPQNCQKFTVTPNGSEQWEIGNNGFLKQTP